MSGYIEKTIKNYCIIASKINYVYCTILFLIPWSDVKSQELYRHSRA